MRIGAPRLRGEPMVSPFDPSDLLGFGPVTEPHGLRRAGEADFGIDFHGSQAPDIDFEPLVEERFAAACRRYHSFEWRRRTTSCRSGDPGGHFFQSLVGQLPAAAWVTRTGVWSARCGA